MSKMRKYMREGGNFSSNDKLPVKTKKLPKRNKKKTQRKKEKDVNDRNGLNKRQ